MQILETIFVEPLLNLLFFIIAIIPGNNFGVAVIILTILIRAILWPLTAKQLQGQKKMQALAPEIAKLKTKANGDKQKESQLLMELYKEKEISPFSACLPALLQFPALIALYFVFQKSTQDVANLANSLYAPIKNMSYIQSIIQDPSSFDPTLFGLVSMASASIGFAIFAGITQFIQMQMLTPKNSDPKDQQAQAAKIMNLTFPALTVFIAWKLPAALPLYWSVTNIFSIIQQKIILNEKVEEMEEVKVIKKITAPTKKKKAKK